MNGDTNNGEITFQALLKLVKRSLVRIVIYCLTAAVVCGAAATMFMLLPAKTPVYNAVIEFNYDGAENGLDPWGRRLDIKKIKADDIITKALEDNNFTPDQRAKLKNNLKDNITIAGVVPEDIMKQVLIIKEIATKNPAQLNELTSLEYISTSYLISLKVDGKLGLNSNQSVAILNSIVDNYIAKFKNDYGYGEALGSFIAKGVDFEKYDYIELYDLFSAQINDILRFIGLRIAETPSFRSTVSKMTFEDMKARVNGIKNRTMKPLELMIFQNGLSKDNATINARKYIADKIESLGRDIAATNEAISSLDAAISGYTFAYETKTYADGSTEKSLVNVAPLTNMQNELLTYKIQLVKQTNEKDVWQSRLGAYDPDAPVGDRDPDAVEKVESLISTINSELIEEIGYINDAVQEYLDVELLKNSVQKSIAAVKVPNEDFSLKVLLIVVFLSVFIAFLAALAVTAKKDKKAGTAESSK